MPKNAFKNPFGRRRSSGNVLDIAAEGSPSPAPAGERSSFRVIERPDKINFDGADRRTYSQNARLDQPRPFNSPLQQARGKSVENLGVGANRGSGSTTNSGVSGFRYDSSSASARYSSTSTLPSSVDQEREPEDDELFPTKRATVPMFHSASATAADASLPPPPSFSARASRALSFGLKSKQAAARLNSPQHSLPPSPVHEPEKSPVPSTNSTRERAMTAGSHASSAMTASSYASTAVPTKVDTRPEIGSTDFGNDFGVNMFDSLHESKSHDQPLPPPPVAGKFHRTESDPMFLPRASSRQSFTPSPNLGRNVRDDAGSPYSFDGRTSYDGLMTNSALSSPRTDVGPGLPSLANGIAPAFLGGSKQGYALVPERNNSPGMERLSQESSNPYFEDARNEPAYANRQTQLDDGDRWNKRYELKDPQESASSSGNSYTTPATSATSSLRPQPSTVAGASRPGAISPGSSESGSLWPDESRNATPRATKLQPRGTNGAANEDSLFDVSPSGPPSRAIRPTTHQRTESGTPKKMTKAQFEAMQRHASSSAEQSDEDGAEENDYEEEDDDERAKQAQKQRRKQEANMAVYRQQMKKVTGGGPSDLPSTRPGLDRSSNSAPISGMSGLHLGGLGGGAPPPDSIRGKQDSDDDEDVPLGILQAHGFPSGARPPTRTGEEQPGYQRAGSIANGGAGQGNLPPFARRLPADPYFGAGLVNPANRESLAFSSSASMYGGASPMTTPMGNPMPVPGGHPGGLVGVIASEESAKAARRTNPNSSGYGSGMPLPSNMGMQMPPMPRAMSMGNIPPPQVYSPSGAPPMPMMPMMGQMPMMPQMGQGPDSNAQMQQFMQMQMQLMQNMLQMQQAQLGQGPAQPQQPQMPGNSFLAPPGGANRPMSMASQAPSFQGQPPNQGRSMTMLTPPSNWGAGLQQQQRPTSSFVHQGSYAPSVQGLQLPGGGPGAGYTPSIAPSERSNVGMPSRYRPVQNGDANGRSQSMTSSMTLQAFQNQQPVQQQPEQRSSTIRVIDKPKGAPKVSSRAVDADEDEDEGWAEMAKKRNEKKFRWGRKEKQESQPALSDLYQNYE